MNKKCLIIRYGELFLKGKNKPDFIKKLVDNLNLAFQKNNLANFRIKKLPDQLIINTENEKDLTALIPILKKIFGISIFYLAYQLESSVESLDNFVKKLFDYYEINFTTFKLSISRNDKNFPKNSSTLQKELGEIIVKKYQLKVNLSNPQKIFYIRIYRDFILVFSERLTGLGGLPVGSSGRALVLLSGGIDSPVAAYQLMKRGLEIVYLHFYQQTEGQTKIFALGEKLKFYNNYSNDIYLVDSRAFLTEIRHISLEKYRLIILKRMFIRYACRLAQELEIKAIVTGDSLAQVASQTLESLGVIQQASITAFEQVEVSTQKVIELGTYEISLKTYADCCALFEPRYPITRPKKEVVEKLEKEIFWEEILEKIILIVLLSSAKTTAKKPGQIGEEETLRIIKNFITTKRYSEQKLEESRKGCPAVVERKGKRGVNHNLILCVRNAEKGAVISHKLIKNVKNVLSLNSSIHSTTKELEELGLSIEELAKQKNASWYLTENLPTDAEEEN
ncbi:1483_t:CDS:2 [Funneliformis geosporum]|uniref:1483_t:CDS:1 n=1 Tax=Funneliformis geosporum TaxID=1117311 RepID=A0A9W4WK52_9GLOM|nr:1483_t:CDS:2 [Funneliformis geosporum]